MTYNPLVREQQVQVFFTIMAEGNVRTGDTFIYMPKVNMELLQNEEGPSVPIQRTICYVGVYSLNLDEL